MFQHPVRGTIFLWLLANSLLPPGVGRGVPPRPVDEPVVLVVCPEALQPGLADWIRYRQRQGASIVVARPAADGAAQAGLIRQLAARQPLKALLLVGTPRSGPPMCPVVSVPARVNVHFGSLPDIATDNPFADLDDDGRPDFPIGRIPTESAEGLRLILARTIRHETEASHSQWRRRINLIAGVGGFEPVIDNVLEKSSEWMIQRMIPEEYAVSMTWGNWSSPYCPDPRRFGETAIARFNEGCLFWVYMGHGQIDHLDRVKTPVGRFPVLDTGTAAHLSAREGNPIAVLLCCNSGAFDAPRTSLAESMLAQAHGPVAVIGSTRVTMPYGESRLMMGLMQELFHGDSGTLGEALLRARRAMTEPDDGSATDGSARECRELIDTLARTFSPRPDLLDEELREHVEMFHLLGDPLLRITRPLRIAADVQEDPRAGELIEVTGVAPVEGELTVEVCYTRGRFWNRPQRRRPEDLDVSRAEHLQADYERTQAMVCTETRQRVAAGPFRVRLQIPERARGEAVIRTFLDGGTHHAAGSTSIEILPALR